MFYSVADKEVMNSIHSITAIELLQIWNNIFICYKSVIKPKKYFSTTITERIHLARMKFLMSD